MELRRRGILVAALAAFAAFTACGGGGGGSSIPAAPAPPAPPGGVPTTAPTGAPTGTPTGVPTGTPTGAPTGTPTVTPSGAPTAGPTPVVLPTTVPTVTPTSPPTVAPTSAPTASAASVYCTTPGAPQAVARRLFAVRRAANWFAGRRPVQRADGAPFAPGAVEVAYARGDFVRHRAAVLRAIADTGATAVSQLDLAAADRVVEVLRVAPGSEESTIARLRSSALVRSASREAVRYAMSTNASAAFPNDPYFDGFAPDNTPPLYESSANPGQWDMHAICAANAWAYGRSNSTGITHPGALGGTAPIAIIDTGADMTLSELRGRIAYSESDIKGVTTPGTVTDADGHGTDVAGIAGAAANNGFGFTGVAYAAPLMIFKVFPDPPCASGGCSALGSDIATAILNAVAHGAKVINLSLGSSGRDTAEESAVASAIARGVVVVAASGNEQKSSLDYPAADPGVIAVGASSLDDSTRVVNETVASYSNYDASNPLSWGLIAPGGDPAGSSDSDFLHWIENIYTSQGSNSSAFCTVDNSAGLKDCRVLIAGTSQAAPHVAGAASLLLSTGTAAGNVKNLLCATATPIVGGKSGCGRLNVYKAMASALGDLSP